MDLSHAPAPDTRSAAPAVQAAALPPALPAPFNGPPDPAGVCPGPAVRQLVSSQVDALLAQTPHVSELSGPERENLRERLVRVAAYAAELVRDDWATSDRLGQRPLVRERRVLTPRQATAKTQAAGDDFRPAAANNIARVTEETLRAIAFPAFVADLLRSTFQAIVTSTIEQLEAFTNMLENVAKTVDEFMADNISDDQARGWLAQRYPQHIGVESGEGGARAVARENAGDSPLPNFQGDLATPETVGSLDDDTIEEILVPAARRRLAQNRLQMLSTMVMLGLQRLVVRQGRIRATMGFSIDTTDRARAEEASLLDTSLSARASGWYMGFSASVATSVTYVRSTRADSEASLNVNADLTGEVDLTFETDFLPLNRFADGDRIERIRANTPNPETNTPRESRRSEPPAEIGGRARTDLEGHMTRRTAVTAPDLPTGPIPDPASLVGGGSGEAAGGGGG